MRPDGYFFVIVQQDDRYLDLDARRVEIKVLDLLTVGI
jgi:hypothetical protein